MCMYALMEINYYYYSTTAHTLAWIATCIPMVLVEYASHELLLCVWTDVH